jgi:hypothetical protein
MRLKIFKNLHILNSSWMQLLEEKLHVKTIPSPSGVYERYQEIKP